jgi:putative ATP-dependent endonuclease of the OLD family
MIMAGISVWTMESLVGWIVDADPAVLTGVDLVAMGVPQTSADLVAALRANLKTDEIVHGLIADAFVGSATCRRRIGCLMQFLSDVAMGRSPAAGHGSSASANGLTTIWTFNHAIPGI